jgi:hypothetical protein
MAATGKQTCILGCWREMTAVFNLQCVVLTLLAAARCAEATAGSAYSEASAFLPMGVAHLKSLPDGTPVLTVSV